MFAATTHLGCLSLIKILDQELKVNGGGSSVCSGIQALLILFSLLLLEKEREKAHIALLSLECNRRGYHMVYWAYLLKWFYDIFIGADTGAVRCVFFVEDVFGLLVVSY
jgi:hypothetical protein